MLILWLYVLLGTRMQIADRAYLTTEDAMPQRFSKGFEGRSHQQSVTQTRFVPFLALLFRPDGDAKRNGPDGNFSPSAIARVVWESFRAVKRQPWPCAQRSPTVTIESREGAWKSFSRLLALHLL